MSANAVQPMSSKNHVHCKSGNADSAAMRFAAEIALAKGVIISW
jgi:hypothetical protein